LPYGVYVRINEIHCLDKNEAITEGFIGGYCKPNMCQDYSLDEIYEFLDEDDDVKLYLRPMSSMTEEEKKEYESFFSIGEYSCGGSLYGKEYEYIADSPDDISQSICLFDWLLAHHFDYRGMIQMGLALEAREGMYKM
jgi:hypothetical protein